MKELTKIMDMLNELAIQIRNIKENECKNSGLNWYDEWIQDFPLPSDFEKD